MGKTDKGELLRAYLEGKGFHVPSGFGWRKMRCVNPAHNDRNPSASINLQTGRFNCFACGLSGDVYDLAHTLDGLTWKQALTTLGGTTSQGADEPTWL